MYYNDIEGLTKDYIPVIKFGFVICPKTPLKVLNLFRNRRKSFEIVQVLNLSRNALPELRLPPSLSSLVALDLSHNKISRIDPAQLGDLPELQVRTFPLGEAFFKKKSGIL